MNDLSNAGVKLVSGEMLPNWKAEAPIVLDTIRQHHHQAPYRDVTPFAAPSGTYALRRDLIARAPGFAAFIEELVEQFDNSCGIFVPELGLQHLDVDSRALIAYAVGLCIGVPTATDQYQIIWDVKPRQKEAGYFSTFSETDLEAAFHTDTQYYPSPEEAFILYTMEPARCGGGMSQVCDARGLRAQLEKEAPWAAKVLTEQPLPFRVPTAFMTTKVPGAVQATIAPVLGDSPFIRYRRDTLADGLMHFPEYGTADVHRALDKFEEVLADCAYTAEFFMPRDSLILLNNHHALHARTAFQDHERHLLRIRLRCGEPVLSTEGRHELVTRVPGEHAHATA